MRKFLVLTLILLACCAPAIAQPPRVGEKLWTGVLLATNQPADRFQPLPPVLQPYRERITRFFGYRFFKVLGERTAPLAGAKRGWTVQTKHFLLNVDPVIPSPAPKWKGGYRLRFAFFEERKLLVRASANVSRGSPLLIRGPLYGRGQVLIVLLVK